MAEVDGQTERVDDLPLLVAQQQRIGLAEIIVVVIEPHGNRQGLSIGWTVVGYTNKGSALARFGKACSQWLPTCSSL